MGGVGCGVSGVWGVGREGEPGDMPLMPSICPPAIMINLSLKC